MLGERFWSKVAPADADACWEWQAHRTTGYGRYNLDGMPRPAHRLAYEELRADIPAGLQLDHLCRNRACVNPWHLEPVTNRVNTIRGMAGVAAREAAQSRTHCTNGHEYADDNERYDSRGKRTCRSCARIKMRKYEPPQGNRRIGPLRQITERIGGVARLARLSCGHVVDGVSIRYKRARCTACEVQS